MSEPQLIGDVIRFDGYDVARLASHGVPSTVMGDFEEWLDQAVVPEEEGDSCGDGIPDDDEIEEAIHAALTDVLIRARKQAHAGLLSVGELSFILDIVKRGDAIEEPKVAA